MRASEFITEKKSRKKTKVRKAAYGPGLYGGYGYFSNYGNSDSTGGDGGDGGGESIHENITPNTIHKLADRKGVKWDNEPSFLRLTKRLTGKEHLDDLDQAGLQKVQRHLEKQGVAAGVPQPGPSSGAPKQFGPDAKIQTRQMTVKDIISSVPGVPYYNNVVDDWDAKDYSWGVTKKVIEYATYLKDHPESLAKLPPAIVLNGKFEDGAHRVSAIWLLQQRMDPKNPLWKNAKLNVQFVKQGVAEGVDIGQEWMSDTELDQYVPERLQQQWRELLGYDENGNPSALWANLTGGYEPDVNDPQHRALMVKVANKWFSAKKIPNVKFFDVKDADDELEWLVQIGQQGVDENFADGKNPQDKGDSKRHGVPTKASVSTLRKVAKQGGRKGQLAHWMANMKAGRNK